MSYCSIVWRENTPIIVYKTVVLKAVKNLLGRGAGWLAEVTRDKICGVNPAQLIVTSIPRLERTYSVN